jgi:hypothetical protein
MSSLAIVKHFDVLENSRPSFVASPERAVMNQLVLKRAEEAFRHRVIVTVTPSAHTRYHAVVL